RSQFLVSDGTAKRVVDFVVQRVRRSDRDRGAINGRTAITVGIPKTGEIYHPQVIAMARQALEFRSPSQGLREGNTNPTAGTWTHTAHENRAVGVIDSLLRGVGQAMFQNNPMTGLLFLVGIFINSYKYGLTALLGLVFATLAAYVLGA